MKKLKSHFKFNKQERSGIFFLLLLVMFLQVLYFYVKHDKGKTNAPKVKFDLLQQAKIDSLKTVALATQQKIYPFNPNYISDHKGYVLGMSVSEIDKLHRYRTSGRFVNNAKEFQQVTGISDSLLKTIAPHFKFPEWITENVPNQRKKQRQKSRIAVPPIKDLNAATAEELRTIRGIGDKLSARIVKFRDRLGGFLVKEQLYDVYGLEPEVVHRAFEQFKVVEMPKIEKININTASVEELSRLVYFSYTIAENVVLYRNANGEFKHLDDLLKIPGYPLNKNERIKLYLKL